MLALFLLSCPGLGAALLPAPGRPHSPPRLEICLDHPQRVAFRRLRSITVKARRADGSLRPAELLAVPLLLRKTSDLRLSEPEFEAEIDLALFEMAALVWLPEQGKKAEFVQIRDELAALGRAELTDYLEQAGDESFAWIANSILGTDRVPDGLRIVAAQLLRGKEVRSTRQALMYTARTSTLELRAAALEALVGWEDAVVNHFFLESLDDDGRGISYLARHFASFNKQLEPRVEAKLLELCRVLYASQDWRDAARARHLVRCLPPSKAIPLLLDALVIWEHRMAGEKASKRILWEVCRELRRLSGTSLAPDPDLWLRWWQGIQSGQFKLPSQVSEDGGELSEAGFYGLQPITDRVLFVIDRSGSMNERIGTDASSRYDEAVGQFVDYMRAAGPETTFSVVLFSDDTRVFSRTLREASTRNLESAERWLTENGPAGGTYLHQAIRVALDLGPTGQISTEKVQADTVIVLCDGATWEGPGWVEAWLRNWNEEAQLVFQCVEIGASGDGTLQALARESGGDYVRVVR